MKRVFVFLWLILLCLPVSAGALTFSGHLTQGGMAVGKTEPGTRVTFQGKALQVAPDGTFVIGFARDAAPTGTLSLRHPDGTTQNKTLSIERRQYPVQRIDGLPQNQVTPTSKADLARIQKDAAQAVAARKYDSPLTDFAEPFIWPVTGRISGVWGSQRILNGVPKRPHFGVDIAAPTGTPVKAPAGGIIRLAHNDMFYSGGTLILDHGHGISTVYMHLSKLRVTEGQQVSKGDIIGDVGATGRVTGPHLHWGMHWFATPIDPSLVTPAMPQPASDKK
ncbi:M23 family metallopeptidase [Desulfosarcina sp. OttesenSCG-928-A07]|nr:M23 family metallopeptidase [Desulfosarcina sp. OttesenSCG-928-G17]MDL2328549.1 M23 family metallopeptidase [Desulfosarcina sp. OttesenSCG-928-A07]